MVRASLVAQIVKKSPAMQETRVLSLGWEDPLEKGMAIHSSILAWRIPQSVYSPWGLKESERTEQLAHSQQVELPKPGVELMPPAEETQIGRAHV